jgi:hypothetical protein
MAEPVLDFLRERFNRLDSLCESTDGRLREHACRINTLEQQTATETARVIALKLRVDRVIDRLEAVERQLLHNSLC